MRITSYVLPLGQFEPILWRPEGARSGRPGSLAGAVTPELPRRVYEQFQLAPLLVPDKRLPTR